MLMKNNRAFTILEIVISSIIIAITVIGLSGIFATGKKYISHARYRMVGGELGQLFMNPFQNYVSQNELTNGADNGWNRPNNPLTQQAVARYCDSVGGHIQQPFCPPLADRIMGGVEYSAKYEVMNHPSTANIRKIITTITWNEPQ